MTDDAMNGDQFAFLAKQMSISSMPMTPSQQAKSEGLKSLSLVSQLTGVSLQTLTNWHRDKPKLFAVVLAGCVASNKKPALGGPVGK